MYTSLKSTKMVQQTDHVFNVFKLFTPAPINYVTRGQITQA